MKELFVVELWYNCCGSCRNCFPLQTFWPFQPEWSITDQFVLLYDCIHTGTLVSVWLLCFWFSRLLMHLGRQQMLVTQASGPLPVGLEYSTHQWVPRLGDSHVRLGSSTHQHTRDPLLRAGLVGKLEELSCRPKLPLVSARVDTGDKPDQAGL